MNYKLTYLASSFRKENARRKDLAMRSLTSIVLLFTVFSLVAVSPAQQASPRVFNSFTPTGSMSTTREDHTATLLNDGKVLVVGGMHWARECRIRCRLRLSALVSAELYDPTTGKFTQTGNMSVPRVFHRESECVTAKMSNELQISG